MAGTSSSARYRAVVGVGWLLLALSAWVYAPMKSVPAWVAIPAAAAFLIEYPFYLLPGFAGVRDNLAHGGKARFASILAIGSVLPWLVCAIPLGTFSAQSLVIVAGIAVLLSFWYVVLPEHPAADLLYVALLGAILLSRVFDTVYPEIGPKLPLSILGHLMLIRTGALAILSIRGNANVDCRIVPNGAEWVAGLRWFAFLIPVGIATVWVLGIAHLRPNPPGLPVALATFAGILVVVAYSEEFFFRGLLQQWTGAWFGSAVAGIVSTSVVFGSVHLGFHGIFPNWRFAIAAGVLGLFCGLARRRTGGIQAGMVTHALAATIWRVYFS